MNPILRELPTPITTPRLILRPPQIGDGLIVNEGIIESLDILRGVMPWAKGKMPVDVTEEFVRESAANWILKRNEEPYLPLFIFNRENQQFIGATGYHHMNWEVPCIETGYWIRKSCAGFGFMTEAINAITQYAFKQLAVKRIAITCDITNIRSRKIPERLGYSLEATLKSNRINQLTGKTSDTLIYARFNLLGLPSLKVEW